MCIRDRIIADKTDVRRSRVREKNKATFDKHDRVNYAVTDTKLKINVENRVISLNLQIDPKICSMYEYFEIFLGRMMMCKRAAEVLEASFKLTAVSYTHLFPASGTLCGKCRDHAVGEAQDRTDHQPEEGTYYRRRYRRHGGCQSTEAART